MVKDVASFQENWRTTTVLSLETVMSDISRGVTPQIFVFRQTLEQATRRPNLKIWLSNGND